MKLQQWRQGSSVSWRGERKGGSSDETLPLARTASVSHWLPRLLSIRITEHRIRGQKCAEPRRRDFDFEHFLSTFLCTSPPRACHQQTRIAIKPLPSSRDSISAPVLWNGTRDCSKHFTDRCLRLRSDASSSSSDAVHSSFSLHFESSAGYH